MTDYRLLEEQVRGLLSDESDPIANAANFAALVYGEIPDVSWAGFYYADPEGELVLGPFQGRPACARLPKGRGACGAAFSRREILVVDDVSQFADHIACDSAARSEIVVPLVVDNSAYGVFDLDSALLRRFIPDDQRGIESLVKTFVSLTPRPKRDEKESLPFGKTSVRKTPR
ncbi:MAG: GAF domain-containing protein [Candidatus Tyrphobacter sp.]